MPRAIATHLFAAPICSRASAGPVVSVVMPAYEAGRFVEAAVVSIRSQTFCDWELIVVDDGSSDDTVARVTAAAGGDERVRVNREEHGGISRALNRGIALARSEWIAIMHADDVALPTRLAKQLAAAAAQPRAVAWGAYAYHVGTSGKALSVSRTGPTSEQQFQDLRRAGGDVYIIHSTFLLRRSAVLAAGGYDPRFDGCEDFELLDRMASAGPVLVVPEPLIAYRLHGNSVTMRRFAHMQQLARFVRARGQARLAGRELEYETFVRDIHAEPVWRRARTAASDTARLCYRRAGVDYADGRIWRALVWAAAALGLSPRYVVPRLWNQLLGPQARDWLGTAVVGTRKSDNAKKSHVQPTG